MMVSVMTGNAADHGTLEAALGVGGAGRERNTKRENRAGENRFHGAILRYSCPIRGGAFRSERDGVSAAGAQPSCAASDFARMFDSVVTGVIASGSILSRMIAGLPLACAALNASAKSSVRSTEAPKPPKARAYATKSGLRSSVAEMRPG